MTVVLTEVGSYYETDFILYRTAHFFNRHKSINCMNAEIVWQVLCETSVEISVVLFDCGDFFLQTALLQDIQQFSLF